MPVKVTAVRFKNEFRTESVDWLLANVGDKITIELDITVETSVVTSDENFVTVNDTDGYIGGGWLTDSSARFVDFKVGDSIQIYNYLTNTQTGSGFTIIDKLSDGEIRVTPTPGGGNDVDFANDVFSKKNPITAIGYKWNFIENDEAVSFNSKVDGTEQFMRAIDLDAADTSTLVPMTFIGAKPYQIGSATIVGDTIPTVPVYQSKFKIVHSTYITPFILSTQLTNLEDNVAPDYFFNLSCLKAIFELRAGEDFNDPNFLVTTQVTETMGNSGWFNENFNSGLTGYSVDSIVYKRADTTVIDAIELISTADTDIEIVIKSTGTPFSNTNTKFTLNFAKVPFDISEYQGNTRTLKENFIFDRALQTVGSGAVNGDNYGGSYQVLKSVTATFTSSSEIKILAKASLVSDVIDIINESENHRYILWVAVQNHTIETKEADKVALLADQSLFFEDNSDPSMIVFNTRMVRHPHSLFSEGETSLSVFPEDEVVGMTSFYVDKNGRTGDDIILKKATARVKAKNSSTLDEFTLDAFSLDLSSLPFIGGNQYVDYSLNRVFHIPVAEPRKAIKVIRRTDQDSSNKYYYSLSFPFLVRWEYWKALAIANDDFFDTEEPNNGWNEFWHRYTTEANWNLYYEVEVIATKNGDSLTYTDELQFESNYYDTNPDWTPNTIKSFKVSDNTELFDGTNKYILGYESVRLEAEFTKVSGTPNLSDIKVVFGIEVFEEGGIEGRRRLSSVWVKDSDTWLDSTTGNSLVNLSLVGSTIKAVCLIDQNLIPLNKNTFKVTARLYEISSDPSSKVFQSDDNFLFQSGDNYLFEGQ